MAFQPIRWLARSAGASLLGGLLVLATAPAQATDVGVSIGINQPGVYGRIDIGRFPQPQLIVQQPVVIYRQARAPEPIYLRVPPGHRQHWKQHCRAYGACGTPVYFVQERWYQDHVVQPAPRRGDRHGRYDDRRDGDRRDGDGRDGPGRGHGRGHGRD